MIRTSSLARALTVLTILVATQTGAPVARAIRLAASTQAEGAARRIVEFSG